MIFWLCLLQIPNYSIGRFSDPSGNQRDCTQCLRKTRYGLIRLVRIHVAFSRPRQQLHCSTMSHTECRHRRRSREVRLFIMLAFYSTFASRFCYGGAFTKFMAREDYKRRKVADDVVEWEKVPCSFGGWGRSVCKGAFFKVDKAMQVLFSSYQVTTFIILFHGI